MSLDVESDKRDSIEPSPAKKSRRAPMIGGTVLLLLIVAAVYFYLHSRGWEDTDDAQIDGHLVPIASRIDGTIQDVKVDDNQLVQAGAVLVQLDPRDSQVSVAQAIAQYDQAAAQLTAARPNLPITEINNASEVATGSAEVQAAEASLGAAKHDLAAANARLGESQAVNERAQLNFQRYKTLFDKHEVSRADFDQFRSTASAQVQIMAANEAAIASAEQLIAQRQAQLSQQKAKLDQSRSAAPLQLAIRDADIKGQRASAEAAEAAVDKANLNLNYGRIVAPVSGVVTQRSAEPGSRVSAGQQLLMIVETDDLWATANFKETQLAKMRPGQHARVYVDALKREFDATVESMPAVTGARTSVLPPENATGNYVKVIQRMPVRLRFAKGQADLDKLRPGMSVEPKVSVE